MKKKRHGWWFLILFVVPWTALTAVALIATLTGTAKQLISLGYISVQGRVLSAEVKVEEDGEGGTSYHPKIKYSYTVSDKPYFGERVRYGTVSPYRAYAREFITAHPSGSEITVYYDPAKPQAAVLQTGISGTDLAAPLFLTPFVVVSIAFWAAFIFQSPGRLNSQIEYAEIKDRQRARVPFVSPKAASVLTLGAAAFVVSFPIAFWPPTLIAKACVGWLIVVVLSMGVYARQKRRIQRGHFDLWLDQRNQQLIVPPSAANGVLQTVPFEEVVNIDKVIEPATDSDSSPQYFTIVTVRDRAKARTIKLAKLNQEVDADQFANWLKERIVMAPPRRPEVGSAFAK
jgi:hypothetical protein